MPRLKGLSIIAAIVLLGLTSLTALAQQVKMPRAKAPMLLFGFEGDNPLKGWVGDGVTPSVTKDHASEGSQAMTFTMPKYEPGGIQYPMVIFKWDDGAGNPVHDWSHYGKLAFDAWIDGDQAQELSIELGNKPGLSGVSEKFTLQPGKKNTIELPDAMGAVDSSNIQEFVFFAGMGRTTTFKVTIDNIRVIPGDRMPLAAFDLAYPNYRNIIFPGAKFIKTNVTVRPQEYDIDAASLMLKVTAVAGRTRVSGESKLRGDHASVSLATHRMPAGTVKLTAKVVNRITGKALSSHAWTLKKATTKEIASFKSYIDASNNLIVDGKPFFPLGWYTNNSDMNVDEVAGSPFNCILAYGTNQKSKADVLKYLDRVDQKNLKIIYCMNDLYPTATLIKSWEGIQGNDAIAKAVVDTTKDHPAVIAWYTVDELPRKLLPGLKDYYRRISTQDPGHPCYIVLYNMTDLPYFSSGTDVLGVDPYPVPTSPMTQVSDEVDIANAAGHGHRAVWPVLQAFAWYQHNSTNPDRSHIPTAEELNTGRAPSYEEGRCMTYLALTHGAKGLLYWCYYDLRWLPQYDEMWNWMKQIGSEVKSLSPMLLSADDLGTVVCSPANSDIHTKMKVYNGELYLMAVNSGNNTFTVTFNTGKRFKSDPAVLFENRFVKMTGTKLTDTFKPLEVHVYKMGRIVR